MWMRNERKNMWAKANTINSVGMTVTIEGWTLYGQSSKYQALWVQYCWPQGLEQQSNLTNKKIQKENIPRNCATPCLWWRHWKVQYSRVVWCISWTQHSGRNQNSAWLKHPALDKLKAHQPNCWICRRCFSFIVNNQLKNEHDNQSTKLMSARLACGSKTAPAFQPQRWLQQSEEHVNDHKEQQLEHQAPV